MTRFNRFNPAAVLCALLLCFSLNASADEIQDANKLFKQGHHAQALNKVDAILSSKPKDAQARFLKALILTEQGQTEESVRLYTALSEDYPELPEPYNNLAVLYAGQGQYDKAKIALEKALRTHASYATAHENLGDIYSKMASQAYDKALQLDRNKTVSATKLAALKDLSNPVSKSAVTTTTIASVTPVTKAPVVVAILTASAPATTQPDPIVSKPGASQPVTGNSSDEVLKATNEWVKAWSSKSINKYLAMYAKDFKTPANETRSDWEQQRRERIAKPQAITVSISNPRVKMLDDTHANVTFVQSYRSGALKSTTLKTLEMHNNTGSWLIQSEVSGKKK